MAEPSPRPLPPHLSVLSGALMGSADAVPGVSGGTIALIIGIYEQFIDALSTIVKLPLMIRKGAEGRAQVVAAFKLLVPLGIGLLAAYYGVTKLLVGKTENPGFLLRPASAPICYAFFFGLVLCSLREPWRRISNISAKHFVFAALGCAAAAIFVGLPYSRQEPATWMFLFGGAGAISVMLLPGVSGSLFLVILGQYAAVAGAVHDRNITVLAVFALGLGLGVITFVPFLRFLLARRHDATMAVLSGLMAGSLRALWPWKDNYDSKIAPMNNTLDFSNVLWVVLAAAAGGAVVYLLFLLEKRVLATQNRGENG